MRRFITLVLMLFAMNSFAQDLNQKLEDPIRNKTVLINKCTREAMTSFPDMMDRYQKEYGGYHPDSSFVQKLKSSITGKQITIVLGTWCGDSQLQVPRFLKLLDLLNIPEKNITFICVDGHKKAAPGLVDRFNITNVPTFIILEKDKQLGRITEYPQHSLEQDLFNIFQP